MRAYLDELMVRAENVGRRRYSGGNCVRLTENINFNAKLLDGKVVARKVRI